jgi:two-component system alkaline phosphatase synthesis response regulator PhoP
MIPTILCVDDERDLLDLLRFRLSPLGCRVLTATSGREALEIILADCPDLLVLDLMLPDIDGFGVCEILRSHSATAGLPIVILSAWSTPESAQLGAEFGALDFIHKPFDPQELAERLGRLIGRRAPVPTSPLVPAQLPETPRPSRLGGHWFLQFADQPGDFADDDWAGPPRLARQTFCRVADF